MGPTLKNGLLELETIEAPDDPVRPGGAFQVRVRVRNRAELLYNDPDACVSTANPCERPNSVSNGYCITTHAYVEGTNGTFSEDSKLMCAPMALIGTEGTVSSATLTLTAPGLSEGDISEDYRVYAYITLTRTDEATGTISDAITVASDAQPPPDDGGNGGDGGDGGGDSPFQLQDIQNLMYLGLGVWGLSSVADLFDD